MYHELFEETSVQDSEVIQIETISNSRWFFMVDMVPSQLAGTLDS